MTKNTGEIVRLSPNTWIAFTLGILTLVVTAVGTSWYLGSVIWAIDSRVTAVAIDVDNQDERIQRLERTNDTRK